MRKHLPAALAYVVCSALSASLVCAQTVDRLDPVVFERIAERHGVPADVLYALARTESGRTQKGEHKPWPWTLNIAGQGRYFNSRSEACSALRAALEDTRLIDVGVAQLNIRWNPELFGAGKRFSDPCAGLDPQHNLDAAAAILRSHFDDTGHWLTAVGRYHRPAGGEAAHYYARAVASRLAPRSSPSAYRSAGSSAASHSSPVPPQTAIAPTHWIAPVAMVWISSGD